ncbi:MAG TPA: cobalamin-independent methionine synthase II family protein [Gammaproteobacteria bacterium]|nr:cobalamin-independent methionine synthase II family protein [Gammaproteobacteria bacterium]
MRRSVDRILTTHTGSLPWEAPLTGAEPDYDARLEDAVAEVVARQRRLGLDVVDEGEYTKGGDWLSFMDGRLGGCELREGAASSSAVFRGREQREFADFYRYAAERGTLFYAPGEQIKVRRNYWLCRGPLTYTGEAALAREIALVKRTAGTEDVFLTTTAPASLEPYYANEYYATEEEFLFGMAEALRVEYRTIASAGLLLQVDDAWLPAMWDRIGIDMGLVAFKKRCLLRVEALNHALAGIPEDRIRYHLCWGSWHGPHVYDLELVHLVDVLLAVNAGAYLIEAANARHEHEHVVWRERKLPDGKILVPGVVTHSTDLVEHPELVAQRIRRFADAVGAENVIAGTDCGFGGRTHPQIAWAKLAALVEGAALASKSLGFA